MARNTYEGKTNYAAYFREERDEPEPIHDVQYKVVGKLFQEEPTDQTADQKQMLEKLSAFIKNNPQNPDGPNSDQYTWIQRLNDEYTSLPEEDQPNFLQEITDVFNDRVAEQVDTHLFHPDTSNEEAADYLKNLNLSSFLNYTDHLARWHVNLANPESHLALAPEQQHERNQTLRETILTSSQLLLNAVSSIQGI